MRCAPLICLSLVLLGCDPVTEDSDVEGQSQDLLVFCLPSTLYVSKTGSAGGTGTEVAPFQTIPQALTYAKTNMLCNVTVFVKNGIYLENVVIDRSVTIRGESRLGVSIRGRLSNATSAKLALDRLTLYNATAPGALVVTNASASTTINDVTINSADRRGVYQSGGTLSITNSTIKYTAATSATAGEGAGVYVTSGTQATLSNVSITFNAQAIVVAGSGTKLTGSNLTVAGQEHNPYIDPAATGTAGLPAIEVHSGALLLAEWGVWNDNEVLALFVRDGGRAHVRHTYILGTKTILTAGGRNYGGSNIKVSGASSQLQLDDFESSLAVVGLAMADGGIITADNGTVQDNAVGIYFDEGTPEGAETCIDVSTVTFLDNDTKSVWETLAVPSTMPGTPFACPSVPWS